MPPKKKASKESSPQKRPASKKAAKKGSAKKIGRTKSSIGAVEFAMMLRRLGETVDGRRDDKLMLVKYPGTDELEVRRQDDPPTRKYESIWKSPQKAAGARTTQFVKIDTITIAYGGNKSATVPGKADSLFWTDSAMEKFVFPYYEQVRIQDESYLQKLKEDIRDPKRRRFIVAVEHDNPSHSEAINAEEGPSPGFGPRYLVADPTLIQHAPNAAPADIGIQAVDAPNPNSVWLTPPEFQAAYDKYCQDPANPPPG